MIKLDEDALICDLAETYHIYDYKQLPLSKVAAFSCGLREDSRIKMLMSNQRTTINNLLLAGINDALNMLVWFKTKDGQKGRNKPLSLVGKLTDTNEKNSSSIAFESGNDFENWRNQLLKNIKAGEVDGN